MNAVLEQQLERWLTALTLRRTLVILAAVVALIAWNRGIALLYGMFALIVGVLAVAWAVPYLNLRDISASRRLPAQANEGEQIPVEVEMTVAGRSSRFMLEVRDQLPFAPDEEQQPTVFFPRVRQRAVLTYKVRCDVRGLHTLGPLALRSSYPLGIHSANRTLSDSAAKILIYPSTFPIARLPLLGGSRRPVIGVRRVSRAGGNDEFFAVRDYRPGDSMRRIHWPATARRGKLVVREYEHLHTTDVMLALDLRRAAQFGSGKHSTVEYMVKIAASIARHVLEQGHGIGLYGRAADVVEVPIGHGPQQFRKVIEVLARVVAEGVTPYEQVVGEATARMPLGGVLVTFDIPGSGAAPAPEAGALRRNVQTIPIVLDSGSFTPTVPRYRGDAPRGGYLVRCGDDLVKVFA